MIVEGVRLHQVDDVEAVGLSGFGVAYPEVVPLSVAPGVVVRFKDQVVLEFVDLDCASQIARFEPRFKYECIVFL